MTNATAAQATMQAEAIDFGSVPLVHGPIYSVNPGTPVRFLINEAESLTAALAELAGDGVESGISPAQSWLLESNLCRLRAVINGIRQGMRTSP